ncbi:PhzF family phenazine biosynthesis protein [Shumkonia mesophila]|uniref:PhzF family phenazine biosynthesis protein n=1 Tax=Shumkonia mesophila TaxID=2838854 RepID=UPI002934EA7E|nr:PhzF family phenazine biosynthesis protein [Shumkonia mesophila]
MKLSLFQIDAFTDSVFSGNPAAVCPLDAWLSDQQMQAIAAENNLSETAFFVPKGDGFGLRWFTPTCEVDLCGHATLATGHLLLNRLEPKRPAVTFETRSGPLTVKRENDRLVMDFPAKPAAETAPDAGLVAAVGGAPEKVLAADNYLMVYASAAEVRELRPRMADLVAFGPRGVIATAPGEDCDFVSRFFAPAHGIPEDPVTGSAHCTLIPYWSARLGKADLHARQISRRGGELFCRDEGTRVSIAGRAVLYLEGTIFL